MKLKNNRGYVDRLGDGGSAVRSLHLSSTLRAGIFDGDADSNAAFG